MGRAIEIDNSCLPGELIVHFGQWIMGVTWLAVSLFRQIPRLSCLFMLCRPASVWISGYSEAGKKNYVISVFPIMLAPWVWVPETEISSPHAKKGTISRLNNYQASHPSKQKYNFFPKNWTRWLDVLSEDRHNYRI